MREEVSIVQASTDRAQAKADIVDWLAKSHEADALIGVAESAKRDWALLIGARLKEVRANIPLRGPKAKEWGEFVTELGITQDSALNYIRAADVAQRYPIEAARMTLTEMYRLKEGRNPPSFPNSSGNVAVQQSASLPAPATSEVPTRETPLPPYTGESGRHLLYPEEAPAQVLASKPLRAAGGEHVDQTAGSVVFAGAGPERGAAVGRSEDRPPGVGGLSDATRREAAAEGDDRHDTRSATVPPARGAAAPGDQQPEDSRGRERPAAGGGADPGSGGPPAADLTEIAAALGCGPELPEILAAIEALKAAAAQPGNGAAEWSALVESAQAWQVRAERAEAALAQVQEELRELERDNTTLRTVPLPASEPETYPVGEFRPGDPLVIKGGRRCLFAAFRKGTTQVIAVWCRPTTKWPRGAWDTVPLSKISRDPEPVDRVADLRALLAAGPAERFQGDIERALAEAEGAVAVEQEPQDGGKKRRR